MLQRVMPRFSAESFLSYSTETFRGGTRNPSVLCFIKFLVLKKYMDKKGGGGGGGISKFSVEYFLSQNAGKFRRGTLQSFNKFGYRKKNNLQRAMSRFSFPVFFVSQCRNRP